MDNSTNGDMSRSSPQSFNHSINHLFRTEVHPKPSTLVQHTSTSMEKMVRFSCHIMFLKQCRDHDLVPKGLTLKDPVRSSESTKILHLASMSLLKHQLKILRQNFAQNKKHYDNTMAELKDLLDDNHYRKLTELNVSTSQKYHKLHLKNHQKKFGQLITRCNVPYTNPYDMLVSFDISHPTFSGLFKQSTPTIQEEKKIITNAVVNMTNEPLNGDETDILSLGLKFSPTLENNSIAKTSSKLEPVLKKLGPAVESAATKDVTNNLMTSKAAKNNLSVSQRKALESLQKISKRMKILPADKGNTTVILTNEQYSQKMEDHLNTSTYSLLKKEATDSLTKKLDTILKKLLKEEKIDKKFYDNSRVLHPRAPQIYGLPKIHKPGTPLRPIVSFYDTPLSALHKQLANLLKPLTMSKLRLKNSEDFLARFKGDLDDQYPYYCSMDVKSLYTTCDMRKAVEIVMERLNDNPNILTPPISPEGIRSLLNFSLDNSYLEYNNRYFRQNSGGDGITVDSGFGRNTSMLP